jgi:hypothetical protein
LRDEIVLKALSQRLHVKVEPPLYLTFDRFIFLGPNSSIIFSFSQENKNKNEETRKSGKKKAGNNQKYGQNKPKEIETIGVAFVDQTKGRELAKRVQQAEDTCH